MTEGFNVENELLTQFEWTIETISKWFDIGVQSNLHYYHFFHRVINNL